MPSTNEIRSHFLNYFAKNNHQIIPSSSLVPQNDPTLLFTNAGMVQFKNVFTGQEQRPYSRATTAQKVVRAGGKHNDLDNVGYTARHHTFFEMLGNFSFGDYFKEKAIYFAWNLITGEFKLPKDQLLVTVYANDDEAANLWKKIADFSDDRIIRINSSDNFWRMGDTGPCGPCSEIFYDHGEDVFGGPPGSKDEDGDRFVEIWNLVFMQYLENPPGTRNPLPRPSIDTGMGLERFAAIMQDKRDNFDIDTFQVLIKASADVTHTNPFGTHKVSHRVIADHLRSSAFLIADGVLPSKDGRGYVLRRIMRRAMRHLHMIGTQEPVFYKLLPALIGEMGSAYPELIQYETLISETLYNEEQRFKSMLDRGLTLLNEESSKLSSHGKLPGNIAFKLYDTYGFPLDLTADALREKGLTVDQKGFDKAMTEQRNRARAAWVGSGDNVTETIWFELKEKYGSSEFLGYKNNKTNAEIQAIIINNQVVNKADEGSEVSILLNQTPFYGESGGQAGDQGVLFNKNARIEITDTQKKLGNLIIHHGTIKQGQIKTGDLIIAEIDTTYRQTIQAHHSATHLLHRALREQFGNHITQKGSLNNADRLRFDFSLSKPITHDELKLIESKVNAQIRKNFLVKTQIMKLEQAKQLGAMALFNEKYGDEVRVVSMGYEDELMNPQTAWSIELCGGTHVNRTGDIGLFHIISESGIASGIRRIEAVAGPAAEKYFKQNLAILNDLASSLNTSPIQLAERVQTLLNERKELKQQISKLQHQLTVGTNTQNKIETINNLEVILQDVGEIPPKELKPLAESLIRQLENGIAVIISSFGQKASIVAAVTPELSKKLSAVHIVQLASSIAGGKGGGGRADMAQAGGPDTSKINEIFEKIRSYLHNL